MAGVSGTIGVTGVSGCLGNLTGGGGGPIPMGSILPITGLLKAYGPGMQKAVNIAKKDINDAGGPLGRQLEVFNKDSGTSAQQAISKYESLVNEQNIVGFVGAASSGVSVPLAKKVAADQVMQVSNASTSPVLATLGYNQDKTVKYFGRTAPNDAQQGIVMARILEEQQYVGADKAAFLHVDNPYGKGLAMQAKESFNGTVTNVVPYNPNASDFTSTLDKLFQDDPQGIGFVGYPGKGRTILKQWAEGGYGGQWVLSEGLNSDKFLKDLKNIVSGMYLASPDPEQTVGAERFKNKIGEANTLFAAHAYDALFLMALAIHKAGSADDGTPIAKNIRPVSRQGQTVTVGEFAEAKDLLDNGNDINYQGASSPVNLDPQLEPLNRFAILRIQS
ncbi:MAG: ABC transporter substrate-binding protein, partial [Halobacteriaceae archaeon]